VKADFAVNTNSLDFVANGLIDNLLKKGWFLHMCQYNKTKIHCRG
jgi:hypothetical protein